jgi:hypothetical protein
MAVLKLVDGFAEEPAELVDVDVDVDVFWEPPPQPARRAATPRMPPTTNALFGDMRIGIPPSIRCWGMNTDEARERFSRSQSRR